MDESFGAAFALRAVWTARGQHPCCPPPAHTLGPLAHRVHKDNNRVKVSGTGKYILVSGGFYYNLQLNKMVHAEYLPTNSAEEPEKVPLYLVTIFDYVHQTHLLQLNIAANGSEHVILYG